MGLEEQISSDRIFKGRIVGLRVDKVRLSNGREATREVVDHNNAVVVIPVDAEENVVLVRQYRYPTGEALLEAPAGVVEDSESPDDCVQRELQEETGYRARRITALGGFWSSPGFCTEYMYAYLARDLVPSRLDADEDEIISVERLPLQRMAELVRSGEVQDAKTIAAIFMAWDFLETQ